jgi:hypothetical protein
MGQVQAALDLLDCHRGVEVGTALKLGGADKVPVYFVKTPKDETVT